MSTRVRIATVSETKNHFHAILKSAHRLNEPILVTRHGKPYAQILPIADWDVNTFDWGRMSAASLAGAWAGEDDRLYRYL